MDNGKAKLFAKGTGLRALLERNGFEVFDYDEPIDVNEFESVSIERVYERPKQKED